MARVFGGTDGTPVHPGAEGDHEDEVALLHLAAPRGLIEEKRNGGRGRVAVALDVLEYLLGGQPEALGDRIADATVRLVRDHERHLAQGVA